MEGSFALNIEKIHIAHKFVLNRVHKCEYPRGLDLQRWWNKVFA